MARRPLAFGLRFRDEGRTLRVRSNPRDPKRYVVEDRRPSKSRQRDHETLAEALRDFASTWRGRLN